jgi:methyltransferase OMS1
LLGFGSAIACLGYFTASLSIYWKEDPAPCYPTGCEPETPTGRPSIQSPYEFDLHLDKSEWRFGITKLRRELGAAVHGHVLEVAIGTGRNFEFYNWDTVTESLNTPEELEKAKKARSSSWMPSWGGGKDKETKKKGKNDPKAARADDGSVLSFTGVDISPGMLDIALRRMRQVVPHMDVQIPKKPSFAILAANNPIDGGAKTQGHVVSLISNRIRLFQSDVQSALPAPPTLSSPPPLNPSPVTSSSNPQKYDTILQTFGLCSVQDPVSLLSLMASSLQPDTGRILLLEHGRSVWDIVNGLLDRGARGHHERFGCWWNRDIEVIVNEAARRVPGLEVLRLERPGWTTAGTHVVVELRVRDTKNVEKPKEEKVSRWATIFPSLLSMKADDPKKKD